MEYDTPASRKTIRRSKNTAPTTDDEMPEIDIKDEENIAVGLPGSHIQKGSMGV
jgi:hypothetical protein